MLQIWPSQPSPGTCCIIDSHPGSNPATAQWTLTDAQEAHIAKLKGELKAVGAASLQNAFMECLRALKTVPPYGHREVSLLASTVQWSTHTCCA